MILALFSKKLKHNPKGNILLFATIFGFITFSLIVAGVTSYAISENRTSIYMHNREQAFQIAEAGINYYRWHLAHNKNDFQDGTGQAGPYVHVYYNKDGTPIGHFSLNITAPPTGSSVVVIESTGWLDSQPNSKRIIKARVGFPSMTDFAFLSAQDIWIGDDEVIHGKMHSNSGIRFDGTNDSLITSATSSYTCKSHQGCGWGQQKPGIWGDGGPQSYWKFPMPAQDFDAVTVKLSDIKSGAQAPWYLAASGKQGWHLQFQSNGTVKVYKVTGTNCYKGQDIGANKYVWYCVDISTQDNPVTYNMPTNGYIYVEDTVWVDGTVKGRATVGTAPGKSIIIADSIVYAAKDGSNVLGLIGSQDVLVPHDSPNNLEVDAAVLAQKGAAKRYYYPGDKKDNLTVYGAIISAGIWTWSWTSGGGAITSGYLNTDSTYDANLTYGPPPGFPVGSEYNLISWEVEQ